MGDHHETGSMTKDTNETEHPEIEKKELLENSHTQGETEMDHLIRSSNQPSREISIQMENWFSSIAASSQHSEQPPRVKPKIQVVPRLLRSIGSNVKCFQPLVISLGPIHSKNPHFQQMDQLKGQFMHQFASECNVCYQDLYDKVASVLNEAKNCYEASALHGLDDMSFCQMMCLDGCFILQFMSMSTSDGLKMNINDVSHMQRDLFLLENQIPYVVLDALMSFRINKHGFWEMLIEVIDMLPLPSDTIDNTNGKPIHLLDILRTCFIGPYYESDKGTASTKWSSYMSVKELKTARVRLGKYNGSLYRSVKELKTAGIHICKADSPWSTKVSFENNLLSWGTLYLSPLSVDQHLKSKLLNMAAYEACSDAPSALEVTSYICFMDELIDKADDVMVLRLEGILSNMIGSDQLVADLFNEISEGLVPNLNIYDKVRHQIDNHCKNKFYVWVAHWMHKYLKTPWSAFGLLAAFIIIMLATTQTWFTVFPRHK